MTTKQNGGRKTPPSLRDTSPFRRGLKPGKTSPKASTGKGRWHGVPEGFLKNVKKIGLPRFARNDGKGAVAGDGKGGCNDD